MSVRPVSGGRRALRKMTATSVSSVGTSNFWIPPWRTWTDTTRAGAVTPGVPLAEVHNLIESNHHRSGMKKKKKKEKNHAPRHRSTRRAWRAPPGRTGARPRCPPGP